MKTPATYLSAALLAPLAACLVENIRAEPPNIIFIITDDHG